MKITTKYNLADEVFIIQDKEVYKAYVIGVSVDIKDGKTNTEYDLSIEYNQGLTGVSIEEGDDYFLEEDVYITLKEAKRVVEKQKQEEEEKEERRTQYKELKKEFGIPTIKTKTESISSNYLTGSYSFMDEIIKVCNK